MHLPEVEHGIAHIDLVRYREFSKYVDSLGDAYVFRGQACDWWDIRPSLANFFNERDTGVLPQEAYDLTRTHLARFRQGLLKCVNEVPFLRGCDPSKFDDMDLWSIGRHYKLCTPILDWTEDPFIAAFFAFYQDRTYEEDRSYPWRVVWAAHRGLINSTFSEFKNPLKRFSAVHFFQSGFDFPRMREQHGLFSFGPAVRTVETCIQSKFQNSSDKALIKISIRDIPNFRDELVNNQHISEHDLLTKSEVPALESLVGKCNRELKQSCPP